MSSRPPRLKRFLLSPGVSIIIGVAGALLMVGQWWALAVSIIMATAMVAQIKTLTLYRGRNYPFIGMFMLLQAALMPDVIGLIVSVVTQVAIILILSSFLAPGNTRTIFFIYLMCGCGALFSRSFAFVALILIACIILLRAFSARGIVAAILGFITPSILYLPFHIDYLPELQAIYGAYLVPGYNLQLIVVGALTFIGALSTFLPSYGYPAQARARNMAILALGAGAIALPFIDSLNAAHYYGILNLCCAYILAHLASLNRHGWLYVVLVWAAALFLIFK